MMKLMIAAFMLFISVNSYGKVLSETYINISGHHSSRFEKKVSLQLGVYAVSASDLNDIFKVEKQRVMALRFVSSKQKAKLIKLLDRALTAQESGLASQASYAIGVDQLKHSIVWRLNPSKLRTLNTIIGSHY